ncbi:hypothetical protein [Roseiconus lacunae]|uniref:hypothetical protein n=1 Tax=Roseiconus lacunae TaxID=2605694 RepID=UPI00135BB010|nr:hypothetical protein [Roseiconus lacunae]
MKLKLVKILWGYYVGELVVKCTVEARQYYRCEEQYGEVSQTHRSLLVWHNGTRHRVRAKDSQF